MLCVIIDSGLNEKYVNEFNIVGYISFSIINNRIIKSDNIRDTTGHGTASFNIINNNIKDKECKFFIIKILDNDLSDIILLRKSLEYCLSLECDIINLSLSLDIKSDMFIDKIIDKLVKKNVIIVSSFLNSENIKKGYPSINSSVIGITGSLMRCDEIGIDINGEKIDLIINMIPEFTDRENGIYCFFSGNSKATALATAYIINMKNSKHKFDLKRTLIEQGKTDVCIYKSFKILSSEILRDTIEVGIKYEVIAILKNYTDHELESNTNLFDENVITPRNIMDIIVKLEESFNFKLTQLDLNFINFISINNIVELVIRKNGNV